MSSVTGVVLVVDVAPHGIDQKIVVNDVAVWLTGRGFSPLADVTPHASGSKHPQCHIFAAGYNYFPEDAFADFIKGLRWFDNENVVLIMKTECEPVYTVKPRGHGD